MWSTLRKRVTLGVVSVLLASLSLCCAQKPPAKDVVDMRTTAEKIEYMSVALLDPDDGHPECGGSWIGRDEILTAAHCVADWGKPSDFDSSLEQLAEALGVDVPRWSPINMTGSYTDKPGSASSPVKTYSAAVIKFDRKNDLALLRAVFDVDLVQTMPPHSVAQLQLGELHDGEPVDICGSTIGLAFTYSHGYIASALRHSGHGYDTVQISGPVFLGNSGGAIFTQDGKLAGVASFMRLYGDDQLVPDVSFWVAPHVIQEFLHPAT